MKKILLVLTCIVAMAMMIVGCGGSDMPVGVRQRQEAVKLARELSAESPSDR